MRTTPSATKGNLIVNMTIDDGVFSMTQYELTANAAAQDIQIKYDEFRKSCKTILPKIDPKLIEDFLFGVPQ